MHGPGVDEPLVWYEGTDTSDRRWYHADERGSVIAVSGDSAALDSVNSYDEYGIPGASNSGRFQYTGQAWLSGTGMYYYRARMYSPTLGRFMQTDPIGLAGGINLYGYVLNDPVNFVDPSGLSPADCREYEVWMYRIIYQVWSPGGVGPGKIVEKYPETRQVCDSGPGDGGGDGEGILVIGQRWTKPPRRVCGPSASNSAFFFEGRTQVGAFIGMPIGLRHGLSHVRVVAAAPPSLAVGDRDWYSGGLGSILIRFASSNRIPIHSLGTHTIVTSRPGSFAAMLGEIRPW